MHAYVGGVGCMHAYVGGVGCMHAYVCMRMWVSRVHACICHMWVSKLQICMHAYMIH